MGRVQCPYVIYYVKAQTMQTDFHENQVVITKIKNTQWNRKIERARRSLKYQDKIVCLNSSWIKLNVYSITFIFGTLAAGKQWVCEPPEVFAWWNNWLSSKIEHCSVAASGFQKWGRGEGKELCGGGHSRVLVVRWRATLTTPFFRPRFPFSRYYA